ncbi:hypothetical protein L1987_55392 [Smallanthus sonchifolius]|uniref:Uncharacterized protein n=1 Tax=Smallanthus sonchifolius TaxID=185202 RepID=A0ACB9E9A3_9ASTR|nr:hypothetical protein L1987_55392 [Smallanthus sonchifolius]
MRQAVNSDERASPSLVDAVYAFDANKLKRPIDHTDPFATRNLSQEFDSAKYGPGTKDTEDLLPRKQLYMPSFTRFPSLQAFLMETNDVKCVSIANPVRDDMVMYYDGNDHDTIAPYADDEPTSATPFQPYQDVALNKPAEHFLLKQFLNGGYSHAQSLMGSSGGGRERECQTNTAVESSKSTKTYYYEGCSDKSGDTAGLVLDGVKSPGKDFSMGDFFTNKSTQGDENEGNFGVHNTSAISTDMVELKGSISVHALYVVSETFTRQVVKSDESASPSLVDTVYTFDANKLMRTIDHTNPFAIRNQVQELDSAKCWPVTKDIEDLLFPRKHPSLQADLMETNYVKDVSIENPVRDDVVMYYDGNNHDTNAPGEHVEVQSNSDMEEDDSQYDVNFDGLADIWKEMTVGLESSQDTGMDLPINQHAKEDEEECDHSFILKEDIGYVCRVCGVVERGIESIIEFKCPKRSKSTKTSYYESRFDKSGKSACAILDGVKSPGKDFSVGEISVHPRHKKQMKPHQIEGFNFLLSNLVSDNPGGCILAHAPGSGKTFMLISFIQSFMAKYPDARPLVVLPRGILATWKKEFKRWQVEDIPLFDFYSQKADNRVQQLEVLKQWTNMRSILFLGYKQFSTIVCDNDRSSVSATCKEILSTFPSLVILDEGHTPRNKNTDVFTAVEKVQTPRKVVLSGTLYQNHVCEVFNILNLVQPRFLKMEDSKTVKRRILSRVLIETQRNLYKKCTDSEFCELVEHTLLKDENFKRKVTVIEDLREMTRNVLHYYKGDFLDELPGHVDFSVFLELSPKQKREVFELKKLSRKFKISSDGSAIYVHPALKSFVKPIQENNDDDFIKIDQVLEKLDEREGVKAKFFLNLLRLCTSTGEKLLVFGQYLLPLKFLLRLTMKVKGWRLNKEIFLITGDHDNEKREVAMDQFNNSSEAKVFFGSIKACGEGISLVGASRIIILDVHLNPSVTRQAIGRAFRPGQVRKVYTYRLVAAGSPEEEDHTSCHRKESIAKMWFEYNEYCGQNEFEMEKTDIKDCGDQFLENPWLNEDVTALYKRLVKLLLSWSAKIGG